MRLGYYEKEEDEIAITSEAEALKAMDKIEQEGTDTGHRDADEMLCELLESFGCTEITKRFRELDKWYA